MQQDTSNLLVGNTYCFRGHDQRPFSLFTLVKKTPKSITIIDFLGKEETRKLKDLSSYWAISTPTDDEKAKLQRDAMLSLLNDRALWLGLDDLALLRITEVVQNEIDRCKGKR